MIETAIESATKLLTAIAGALSTPNVSPKVSATVCAFVMIALTQTTMAAQTTSSDSSIVIPAALVKVAQTVEVPVEVAGVLAKLNVTEGQRVSKGDLIGQVKDHQWQLKHARANLELEIASMAAESQVDIEYAEKSYSVAAADLQRSESANQRVNNSIPTARIEKQKLEKDRTRLQLQQAERDFRIAQMKIKLADNDLKTAQAMLDKTRIVSPVDGVVVALETQAGQWVEPSETIVRIVRVDRLKIEGFLPANQARHLKLEMPVSIRFDKQWAGEPVAGKIIFISPEANAVNLNVQVWAEFENPDQILLPGLKGDIVINSETHVESQR